MGRTSKCNLTKPVWTGKPTKFADPESVHRMATPERRGHAVVADHLPARSWPKRFESSLWVSRALKQNSASARSASFNLRGYRSLMISRKSESSDSVHHADLQMQPSSCSVTGTLNRKHAGPPPPSMLWPRSTKCASWNTPSAHNRCIKRCACLWCCTWTGQRMVQTGLPEFELETIWLLKK